MERLQKLLLLLLLPVERRPAACCSLLIHTRQASATASSRAPSDSYLSITYPFTSSETLRQQVCCCGWTATHTPPPARLTACLAIVLS